MKIKELLVVLLVMLANHCFSQLQFQHITAEDGISQSEVYCFLEDSHGFMWFGTVDGLNKYDGYTVSTFNIDKDSPNSIVNNTIKCLAEDELGRIWIGTDDGLCVYDSKLEKISQLGLGDLGESRLMINTALINEGNLYLGTSNGLLTIDVQSSDIGEIGKAPQQVSVEKSADPLTIVASRSDHEGNTWVITTDKLYLLSAAKGQTTPKLKIAVDLSETMPDLRNLEADNYGNLWIVSHDNGFMRYNPTTNRSTHFKKGEENPSIISNKFSSVTTDQKGNLWIGTHDKGLLFLQNKYLQHNTPAFQTITHDPFNDRSLNSNLVYSLYSSNANLLWVGTIGSGINLYNPDRKPFQYYNLNQAEKEASRTNFIRAVYADEEDFVWIGTHNNGLFLLERSSENRMTKAGFDSEPIFHINAAEEGRTLVCSGLGVSLVQKDKNKIEVLSSLLLGPSFYVSATDNGTFWVATLSGVKRCKLTGDRISLEQSYDVSTTPALSLDNCRVLNFNKETSELFIGTEGGGLNILKLDDKMVATQIKVYKKEAIENSLSNNYIRTIIQDKNSDIWIGTYEGLNKLHREPSGDISFTSYTQKDGLPNNTIQSIVEDEEGFLWIGTNNGLCKFDPKTKHFVNFTMNDGIQSNEFSEHTIFKNSDNEIFVGGINGINTFYPEEITSSEVDPNLTITDFYLFNKRIEIGADSTGQADNPLNKSISLTDSIVLKPYQNSIGFDFSAIDFNAPEKIQYAYMLAGFDENWNFTDASIRRANYTNLGYGKYTFKVKSTNNDGVWLEEPKQIYISIKTPFYFTALAFLLYGVLAILGIYFLANYSILRYTTKNKILLENQHNKKVRELEDLRTRFFINISHDLRTPLTLISSPLGVLLKNSPENSQEKSLLGLMQRNVSKLKDMTEQLLDISKVEAGNLSPSYQNVDIVAFSKSEAQYFKGAFQEKGIELELSSTATDKFLSFDPDMISKVMFNLLSNALKHTPSGKVSVSITEVSSRDLQLETDSKHENYVELKITDTGEGIDEDDLPVLFDRFYQGQSISKKGYGIGLSHTKDLMDAHDGYIVVESKKGFGASFKIYLPDIQGTETVTSDVPTVSSKRIIDSNSPKLSPTSTIEEVPNNDGKLILLVEDNDDLRNFMATELRKTYKVLEASDGAEGLKIAKQEFPDLILSDVMMPNMDGIEFCKEIKSALNTSHIPVVLLTAKIDKETKYKGLEIGADDYIAKPFEVDFLLLRIQNLLENRDRMRELFRVDTTFEPKKVTVTLIDQEFLTKLMSEMEKGISDSDFSISNLEQEMGMSHASFYKKIKGLTGQSAKELVLSMRMKRAKQVIEDTDNIRISEVAYMVGFTDPKYFSKSFKGHFGHSPSHFSKK
ncbi:MAG: two-component regulator propeller domain-containing protein [Saprospiraceae bacterium]